MHEPHLAYLSLGSNIQPEENLPAAIEKLSEYGEIIKMSRTWESEPVGGKGSNYWNICVLYESSAGLHELKDQVIDHIETQLGRTRTHDKFAPRPIDIDIILFDGKSVRQDSWELAFVVVPLAEIHPEFTNPNTLEPLRETAARLRREVWMEVRQGRRD